MLVGSQDWVDVVGFAVSLTTQVSLPDRIQLTMNDFCVSFLR